MCPEVLWGLIVAEPESVHKVEEISLAGVFQYACDLRARVCAAVVAVLIELAVALVRPA